MTTEGVDVIEGSVSIQVRSQLDEALSGGEVDVFVCVNAMSKWYVVLLGNLLVYAEFIIEFSISGS